MEEIILIGPLGEPLHYQVVEGEAWNGEQLFPCYVIISLCPLNFPVLL